MAGLIEAGSPLERPHMAFWVWGPRVQWLSLSTGLLKTGYRCAEVQEPQPSGVCVGLRGAWLDLEGGHLQPRIASSVYSSAPNKCSRAVHTGMM